MSLIAYTQGLFYLVSGIWPLFSLGTFMRVTGYKTDRWLVKTVGLLLAVIGWSLTGAGVRDDVTPDLAGLGMGTAAAVAAVDIFYLARRRISPIYLLDAVIEAALVAGWLAARRPEK